MDSFVSGEAHVLVATTVIEVGIDVPNATVMLVEGAERFGLSQLHQLRGRVGRGSHESFCILFGDPESEAAKARLEAIAGEGDGFALAEVDLSIRGEGEILGTRQHGLPRFRAATLPEDTALLLEARRQGAGAARALRFARGAGSRPADGRGPPALRRRAGRADRGLGGCPSCGSPAANSAAAASTPRRGPSSGRPRSGCARRSSRSSATSRALGSSISSAARARWRSRRSPGGPREATLVDTHPAAARRNLEPLELTDRARRGSVRRGALPAPCRGGVLRSRALRPSL